MTKFSSWAKLAGSVEITVEAMLAPVGRTSAAVWVSRWVSTPMTASTSSASMVGLPFGRRMGRSGAGQGEDTAWQDCDESRREADRLLIRPTCGWPRPAPAASGGQVRLKAPPKYCGPPCLPRGSRPRL